MGCVQELVCSGELNVNVNFVVDGEHERGCRVSAQARPLPPASLLE